jgi:nucleotide-binding universal stress UspA family protein
MFRTLLVPLDGSPLSETALPLAAAVARRAGAVLHLVHVAHPSATPIFVEGLPVIDEQLHSLGECHDRAYLELVAERLRREGPLEIVTTTLGQLSPGDEAPPVATQLANHAVAVCADLLVMTTHGWGGVTRFWLGSVAEALVRLCPTPVLLLRSSDEEVGTAPATHLRNILVPLDGSARSEAILAPALTLGRLFDASYTLLHVVVPAALGPATPLTAATDFDPERTVREQAEAREQLAIVARRLAAQGAAVETEVVVANQVAPAILGRCRHKDHDLIAMTTAGRSGVQRLLVGSVADKVLRGSAVPLLLHRDPPPAEHDHERS